MTPRFARVCGAAVCLLVGAAAFATTPTPEPPRIRINIGNALGAPGRHRASDRVARRQQCGRGGDGERHHVQYAGIRARPGGVPRQLRHRQVDQRQHPEQRCDEHDRAGARCSRVRTPPRFPAARCTRARSASRAAALPGTYRLDNTLALATTPDGATITGVNGTHGAVTVSLIGRACSGDCNGDGSISIDELIVGVNIALGNRPVDDCLSLDPNGDGAGNHQRVDRGRRQRGERLHRSADTGAVGDADPDAVAHPLYVRSSGSDDNGGHDPANALRTITKAAQRSHRAATRSSSDPARTPKV